MANKKHSSPAGLSRAILKAGYKSVSAAYRCAGAIAANLARSIYCKRKIAAILKTQLASKKFAFGKKFCASYGDTRWHQAYANANGIMSDDYVPEDLFYVNIEAKLNPPGRVQFYLDKNCADKLRLPCCFPRTLGRIIRGTFFDGDYRPANPEILSSFASVVVKPSLETGGGRNVTFMPGAEAARFVEQNLSARAEYILQEPIRQHAGIAAFAPDSINTIRIMTMLLEGAPRVVSSVLRMGRAGSKVDNQAAGGVSCGIKDGHLIANAYNKNFLPYVKHPDTGVSFANFKVPGYETAAALCLDAHRMMPEIGLISWDVAIDETERPIVIEMNMADQEINFHQLAHGPLFGDGLAALLERTRPRIFFNIPVG